MNRQEHILVVIAEEASEVAKVATKALRFGLDHVHGETTNHQKLVEEFADLVAMVTMIRTFVADDDALRFKLMIAAKEEKFNKFLEYSKACGTLTE
jgi:NTP pyrophosphatase (non-canonical NTP hydrolase)